MFGIYRFEKKENFKKIPILFKLVFGVEKMSVMWISKKG